MKPTRREFVAQSGSAVGGLWLARFAPLVVATQACAREARIAGAPFTTFDEREAADFDAFAARIVPSDETPGAREAGSVYFADRALGDFLSDLLPIVRSGLQAMNERVRMAHPDVAAFSELEAQAQDDVIRTVEEDDPGFFFFARSLVVLGLVANEEYGGNRNGLGWRLIGFVPSFAHQPPFGYYDRDEHGSAEP